MKNYLLQLVVMLVWLYLCIAFFILADLVDGSKLSDYRFHFGLFAIAVFGSMFRCYLKSLRGANEK